MHGSLVDPWGGEASGGRMRIKVFGAGEIVPAFEVFDAVSRGVAEAGHGAAYYWKGKIPAAVFYTAVPFGMTAQEANGSEWHAPETAEKPNGYREAAVSSMSPERSH